MQEAENTAVIRGNCVVIIADRVVKSMFSSVLCHPVLLQVIFQSYFGQGQASKRTPAL